MGTGVKKVSELITKNGRALIMTDTFGARWEFIPDGTLKIDPITGNMAVKIQYADDWISVPDSDLPAVGTSTVTTFDLTNKTITDVTKIKNKTIRTSITSFKDNSVEEIIEKSGLKLKKTTMLSSNSIKEEVIKIV